MPKKEEDVVEVMKEMWITQLLLAGVKQSNVQKIVKVDIARINRVGKLLRNIRND